MKQIVRTIIYVSLICTWFNNTLLATEQVVLNDNTDKQPLALHLSILEDKTGELTIDDIRGVYAKKFNSNTDNNPNFGLTSSAFWTRFKLQSQSTKTNEWFLDLARPRMQYIDLYVFDGDNLIKYVSTGMDKPAYEREIIFREFVFRIKMAPGDERQIFMRTQSKTSMMIPLFVYSTKEFTNRIISDGIFTWFAYGAILALIIYNLFLFISVKSIDYLLFVLSAIVVLFYVAIIDGYAELILWPLSPSWTLRSAGVFALLVIILSSLFANSFLRLQEYAPRFRLFILGMVAVSVMMVPAAFLLDTLVINRVITPIAALWGPTMLIPGVLSWRAGNSPARMYLLGYGAMVSVTFYFVLCAAGLFPRPEWVHTLFKYSYVVQQVLLSLALADRINLMRSQLSGLNQNLEQNVVERTRDLKLAQTEALIAKEKAEKANRAKSVFLSNMSHELRTPLNAILGFSRMMSNSHNLTTKQTENLHIINHSGEHLLTLINNVLDMSKIEAGQVMLTENDFDLYRLLDDLWEMFETPVEKKGLEMSYEYTKEVPQFVKTDEAKLRQVLINLIGNAVKFTSKGGIFVRVSVGKNGQPSESSRNSLFISLHFEIEDTGPGIEVKELDNIFKAFLQTKTGKDSNEGTGLGLSISQEFVQLMDGKINIDSHVGRGTVFSFDIKTQIGDKTHIPTEYPTRRVVGLQPASDGIEHQKYRILIVDDVSTNRQVLGSLLSPLGFKVKEVDSGQEALVAWKEWQPQLILLDMRMPEMDGYEVIRRIKSSATLNAPPIISISASAFDEDKQKAFDAGCDGFVRKPFKESEIFAEISKHLGLQYIYEEITQEKSGKTRLSRRASLTLNAVSDLPMEWKVEMKQAIEHVNLDQMHGLVEQVRKQNEILAIAIQKNFDQFQYEKILDLLQ